MSTKIGDTTIISKEPNRICEICGKEDECRPYGPNGEDLCYDCAMQDPITTEVMIAKTLFGDIITREEAKNSLIKRGIIKQ